MSEEMAPDRPCSKVEAVAACTHIDSVEYLEPPAEAAGCEECLKLGMSWVHLRMCQSCGHIGCCDNSQGRHATAHYSESGHPIIRSIEPGEDWSWCYVDEAMFRLSSD
ncbi:MAG TPA: UBP-type zinc finger domain-containing protein [Solirubrobacterales bacterium]|nr:UBP-type zinc finger domain-containing protein [Solirubrobacterales bacterium]